MKRTLLALFSAVILLGGCDGPNTFNLCAGMPVVCHGRDEDFCLPEGYSCGYDLTGKVHGYCEPGDRSVATPTDAFCVPVEAEQCTDGTDGRPVFYCTPEHGSCMKDAVGTFGTGFCDEKPISVILNQILDGIDAGTP